ncbi:periplasmic binding protein [Rhodovulum sp. PH10]|uniref:energy transducer TonB n=1 Tax=Rhodovulum sp. PH10 TaxID=1187851 RepID=UPI00027C1FB2|nr:energy transducer TonB [Rhodovulum sp. PH10]EJW13280.1 periplasmic binding protein [Rhodovulum sp. PH10]
MPEIFPERCSRSPDRSCPRLAVRAEERPAPLPGTIPPELSAEAENVLVFRPRHGSGRRSAAPSEPPAVEVLPEGRPAPLISSPLSAAFMVGLLVSLSVHLGLLRLADARTPPMASTGEQVMSVELVLGGATVAGRAETPSEDASEPSAAATAAGEPEREPAARETTSQEADEKADEKADQSAEPEQQRAAEPPPETTKAEVAPQQVENTAPPPDESPDQTKEAAPAPAPAPYETVPPPAPDGEIAAPAPETVTTETPAPERPAETTPPATVAAVAPVPPAETTARAETPVPPADPRPDAASVRAKAETAKPAPQKPAARTAHRPARPRAAVRSGARGDAAASSEASPSRGSSGVGRGRSDAASNYPGLVAAHLARFQRYPEEARRRRETGTATVAFALDGGGRVVSAALAGSSGSAVLDREVLSMVRRASPFPAPPPGAPTRFRRPIHFTVR